MTEDGRRELSRLRIEQADHSLKAAELLLSQGLDHDAINRAYYAMFYAVLALLATQGKDMAKHSGVISYFDREFVKSGLLPKSLSQALHQAFLLRQKSDYAPFFSLSRTQAQEAIARAVSFVAQIHQFLDS